jgi:hypothetical protein
LRPFNLAYLKLIAIIVLQFIYNYIIVQSNQPGINQMKMNSILMNPIIDGMLNEIVNKRRKDTGLTFTKKGVVAELINAQHKKEIKE